MLKREELREHNKAFWKAFHQRMRKRNSSNGKGINWLQYPTNLKDVYVRLEASKSHCAVCIDIQTKDDGIRALLWEQMTELRAVLIAEMSDEGTWSEEHLNEAGQPTCRISWTLKQVNYFNPEDHETIYNFLEKNLVGFDKFYQEYKEILILLMQ